MTIMVTSKYNIVEGKMDDYIAWMKADDGLKLTRAQLGCEWVKQAIDKSESGVVL